jgi:hypothetical protein
MRHGLLAEFVRASMRWVRNNHHPPDLPSSVFSTTPTHHTIRPHHPSSPTHHIRDLPALELAYTTTSSSTPERKSSFVCLDSFTSVRDARPGTSSTRCTTTVHYLTTSLRHHPPPQPKLESSDPYVETWTKVFEFWEYPAASVGPAVTQAQKHDIIKRPEALGGHGTVKSGEKADGYRAHLFAVAVDVDREYFGGKYAKLAGQLKCPQPSDGKNADVDRDGSKVGWDARPLKAT